MSNDFRIRVRSLVRDSYEDDHSPSCDYHRWTPTAATTFDRRIIHTILVRCFQYLQSGNSKV